MFFPPAYSESDLESISEKENNPQGESAELIEEPTAKKKEDFTFS